MNSDTSKLKPNRQSKADVPIAVPKLPTEYIHCHQLMKQVINCLLDRPGAGPRDTDEVNNVSIVFFFKQLCLYSFSTHMLNANYLIPQSQCYITSISSRHSDKAKNGKTTLAIAAI